ncbi:MAG: hypothetical protein RR998_09790 [Oscillospiraceae bacterium]
MKKSIALILALILALSFVACGHEAEPAPAPQGQGGTSASQPQTPPEAYRAGDHIKKLYKTTLDVANKPIRVVMKTKIDMGDGLKDTFATIFCKGNNFAGVFEIGAEKYGMISSSKDAAYFLMYDGKIALESNDIDTPKVADDLLDDDIIKDTTQFLAGTEDINGVTYDYEEIKGEDVRFYFEQGTERWKFMKSDNELTEIVEYDNNAEDSVFVVPSDFTIMDMDSMPNVG